MNYSDGIEWLKANGVKNAEFGQCIDYMTGRQMADAINEPILLCRFPAEIKSFYMQRDAKDTRLTESVEFHHLSHSLQLCRVLFRLMF